jgi:hypothetical protein
MPKRISHKDISARLASVSIGVGALGATWEITEGEREIAGRVVSYLEDRRVLYNDYAWEVPRDCIESVIQIRALLTNEIASAGRSSRIGNVLAGMRAECRRFLDAVGRDGPDWHHGVGEYRFFEHLGGYRRMIGFYLAEISAAFQVDLPEELRQYLPISK